MHNHIANKKNKNQKAFIFFFMVGSMVHHSYEKKKHYYHHIIKFFKRQSMGYELCVVKSIKWFVLFVLILNSLASWN